MTTKLLTDCYHTTVYVPSLHYSGTGDIEFMGFSVKELTALRQTLDEHDITLEQLIKAVRCASSS